MPFAPCNFDRWLQDGNRRPLLMGVLNVTPDSFSDGGKFLSSEAAIAHARRMVEEGADLIDIGGESTRPGSTPVSPEEQIRRVLPVISALSKHLAPALSIDTTSSVVAQAALDAGACMVNDVSAGRFDPAMFHVVATLKAPIILMHMLATPTTMQANPVYQNVTEEIAAFLHERTAAAVDANVHLHRILIDPGIGFGKTVQHNLTILRELPKLVALGRPVVIGTSRKKFIGILTAQEDPEKRVFGTAATVAWAVANGAAILRVHDVGPMAQVLRMIRAVQG